MIFHEQPVYRPPSEARSLILQATIGCSHNRCAFCVSYQQKQFRARPTEEIMAEIDWAGQHLPSTRRVFLADGDALALSTDRLLAICERLRSRLPRLERVTMYASPQNLKHKSIDQLSALKRAGVTMFYVGIESGSDEILERIQKGVTAQEMIAYCAKSKAAAIDLSLTVILGLGGPNRSRAHAEQTAQVLDAIRPKYASALTLMLEPRSPSYERVFGDPQWRMLDSKECLLECRTLLENMADTGGDLDEIIFRSNHASNYLALAGVLPNDKQKLLYQIDRALDRPESSPVRPEFMRGL